MTTKALDIYKPETYETMKLVAGAMAQSGYFDDAKELAQAIVKVQAGAELGFGPFTSMAGIHVIKSKPTLSANLIATLIKNDPRYDYRVRKMEDTEVSIEFFEEGESLGVSTFTAKDAQRANTQNMHKFPRNMLFARAMSNGAKWYTPGVFGGAPVYTPDELGADVDEDGNIIEGEVVQPPPAPLHGPDPVAQVNDLLFDDNGDEPEVAETKQAVAEALAEPKNGNGQKLMSAVDFRGYLAKELGFRNDHHVIGTLKLLGFWPTPMTSDERRRCFEVCQAYRDMRDNKGISQDDALAALADEAEQEAA